MELRHLRSFCAVARELHVTKAANRLRIAQPALTQQIRYLERELGLRLIRRTGRGIALTEAGAFFYKEADLLLLQMENIRVQTQEIARGNSGHLLIGVTEASAFYPALAVVFKQYRAEWPSVQLTFHQRQATELAATVQEEQLDAAFTCPLLADGTDLREDRLSTERMLLIVPATHPLAARRIVDLSALDGEPLIVASHGPVAHPFETTLNDSCREEGFSPRVVQICPEYILALNLVAAGVGLTFVPEYMAHARSDALRSLRIRAKIPLTVELCLVTRPNDTSPRVTSLRLIASSLFLKKKRKGLTLTLASQ